MTEQKLREYNADLNESRIELMVAINEATNRFEENLMSTPHGDWTAAATDQVWAEDLYCVMMHDIRVAMMHHVRRCSAAEQKYNAE